MLCFHFGFRSAENCISITNLANPKNPNLNLDPTDYGCKIRLMSRNILFTKSFDFTVESF